MRRALRFGLMAVALGVVCAGESHGQSPTPDEAPARVVFLCHGGQSITVWFRGAAATLSMTRASPGAMDTRIARDLAFMCSYTLPGGHLAIALQADAGIYVWAPARGGR